MTEQSKEPQNDEAETTNETVADVAKKTMVGDMRDVCLQIIRDPKLTGKAWKDMSEGEQKHVAETITNRVTDAVVSAVQIIAADGKRQIIGILEQVTNKDGMKSVIKTSAQDELRHELNDSVGHAVAIVLSDADEYLDHRAKVKIDKDQPELLDEDSAETPTEEGETENETGETTEEGGSFEEAANEHA